MKDDNSKHRDRIPSRDLTAYERWELPTLDDQGNEIPHSRIEERNVRPLTAGEVERIRQEAWEEGHREGKTEGYDKGYREGHEAGHADGREQGVAEGREEGRAQALVDTRQEVEAGLQRLETLMTELLSPVERQRDEVETALLNLACALSRSIVYRELSIDSTQISRVVTAALETLPSAAEQVSIHVNPVDLEWTRQAAQRINPDSQVVPDDTVMPGGCRVDSRHSLVDFTVEKRFQKTIQQMLDGQLARAEGGESSGELDAVMGELTDFHRDVLEEAPELGTDGANEGGVDPAKPASSDADDADQGHDQSD